MIAHQFDRIGDWAGRAHQSHRARIGTCLAGVRLLRPRSEGMLRNDAARRRLIVTNQMRGGSEPAGKLEECIAHPHRFTRIFKLPVTQLVGPPSPAI